MNFKEIQQLIRLVDRSELTEFKMKENDFEIVIRTKSYNKPNVGSGSANYIPMPQHFAPPQTQLEPPVPLNNTTNIESPSKTTEETDSDVPSNVIEVKSPIVGTFYRSASPDKPAYVKVGDHIEVGSVVCIVEAMKLFNEIESEVAGKIVKVMVEDASPVEYDQVLFLVEPA